MSPLVFPLPKTLPVSIDALDPDMGKRSSHSPPFCGLLFPLPNGPETVGLAPGVPVTVLSTAGKPATALPADNKAVPNVVVEPPVKIPATVNTIPNNFDKMP